MKTTELSKFLSYILRHEPESIGLSVDEQGWLNINELISAAHAHGHVFSKEQLNGVVETSDKKRFAISENGLFIRAVQGHSNPNVNITFVAQVPPKILYHGTASRFVGD